MTPSQFFSAVNGYFSRLELERKNKNADLYNLACLIRAAVWEKMMPDFERVFPKEKKEMTDEEMYAQVRALNALFGGSEV